MLTPFQIFDFIIGIIAFVSIFLILKNMRSGTDLALPLKIKPKKKGEVIEYEINGKKYAGIAYISDNLPRGGEDLPKRLIRIARSSRLSVSFISNMYNVNKSSLLKLIDEEMKKADLSFSTTNQTKYRERLRFLEDLYKEVARIGVPYIGSFGFIVWIDKDDRDSELYAESFRSLVEAEAQIKTRRISNIEEILSITNPMDTIDESTSFAITSADDIGEYEGIVIGEEYDEHGKTVLLSWPDHFKHHIGIFGPTGRGKTVLLAGIAMQLSLISSITKNPQSIIVIDPKGDLSSLLRKNADFYIEPGINDCVKIPRMNGLANKLIESSMKTGEGGKINLCEGHMEKKGLMVYNLSKMPNETRNVYASLLISSLALQASEEGFSTPLVLIIDETWRIVNNSYFHLEFAMREGRSKGLYTIYATQIPSDVGKNIIDNTGVKVIFGGFTNYYVDISQQIGIENADILKELPVGHMILKIENNREKTVKVIDFNKLLKKGENS
ncbi:putative ATPase [Caldisphaera lagunensis DSM 15908]|uniref:Putative ATPase n=1 Tax=Caldisphaera lagunensis (strain DSM 15908 / JCM 11604 / ANMR 0165 / IC-154) TaxID=1056495 RepID=L0AC48_CALLD|nr:type IV secretory system conjugative DNA transfer family protein [Caldisphaera lagunensis]AFZ70600.1 putative ATPase [Caldisphaera lagunensis DSM 15908]